MRLACCAYGERLVSSRKVFLAPQEAQGVQFAEYLTVLQQAGENEGLMDIEDVEQDEWVPISIVQALLNSIVGGIVKVLREIHAEDDSE